MLIAGLFRALVAEARGPRAAAAGVAPMCGGRHEWLLGAAWRAARSGLEGTLVARDHGGPADRQGAGAGGPSTC
ncbi:UNVERIFIED_CONTAM: gamma-glutamyl:cysteine ligase YbdK (ATP-grasp superfamily) [Streptomyces canus]